MAYLGMSNVTRIPLASEKPALSGSDESRLGNVAEAIKTLLDLLSPQERDQVLRKVTEKLRPISAPKAGEVLEAIVLALPQRRDWTVEELRGMVQRQGVEATPKEVNNAIGYLTRKKHIRRVGYGRYIVDGTEVITSDDLGGDNARYEDAYRVDRE